MPNILSLADRVTIVQLVFLAIVAGLALKHLACQKSLTLGRVAGGILLAVYFLHRFSFEATFEVLALSLLRSICMSRIGMCVTCVLATIGLHVLAKMRAIHDVGQQEQRRRERLRERQRMEAEKNKPQPAPPKRPPPPSFAERMQKLADTAREEYEVEIKALDSLPLDADEREVLAMRAKRNLLRKLKEGK